MTLFQRIVFILLLATIQSNGQDIEPSRAIIKPFISYGFHDMMTDNLNNYYRYGEGKFIQSGMVDEGFFMKGGVDVAVFLNKWVGVTAGVGYCGYRWEFSDRYTQQLFPGTEPFKVSSRQRWVQAPLGLCVRTNRGRRVGLYAAAGVSIWLLQHVSEQTYEKWGNQVNQTKEDGKLASYRSTSYAAFSDLALTVRINRLITAGAGLDVHYQVSNNFSSDYKRGHFFTASGKLQLMFTL